MRRYEMMLIVTDTIEEDAAQAVVERAKKALADQGGSVLDEGIGLLELMTAVGACASNGEARRLVQQGAVRLNNAVVDEATRVVTPADLAGETTVVLRTGRRRQFLARFV